MINLENSKTKENLMRAFAGESQARNRYTFAAKIAKKEGYPVLEKLFNYTANQEMAHAWEFMKRLKKFTGQEISISANYPAEVEDTTLALLKLANKHEKAESNEIYKEFAQVAREEGFDDIATLFENIASIEKTHSERFERYAMKLENKTLFKSNEEKKWICTNCGFIFEGNEAPLVCAVCKHPQEYFMLLENSNFE